MNNGQRIIDSLKEAIAGDLARVTIDGQTWVKATDLARDQQEIMRINNELRSIVLEARPFVSDTQDDEDPEASARAVELLKRIDATVR